MRKAASSSTADRALDCLEEIAMEKGLDSLSMRDVATRIGISLSSLQYHYPSKAALIDAFVQRAIKRYERDGEDIIRKADGAPCLPDMLQYSIDETLKTTEGGLFAMIEARAQHDESTAEAVHVFWRASLEGYAEAIEHDHPDLTKSDVLLAATLIASMIEGFASTHKAAAALGLDTSTIVEHVKRLSSKVPSHIRIA